MKNFTGIIGIFICIIFIIAFSFHFALGQTDTVTTAQVTELPIDSILAKIAIPDTIVVKEAPKGDDFLDSFIGTEVPHGQFLALMLFGLIGAIAKLLVHANSGVNKINNGTPTKWNIGFMFHDNWKRLLLGAIIMFAIIRFYDLILLLTAKFYPEVNSAIDSFPKEPVCIVAGFFIDYIAQKLKAKYPLLQVNRKPKSI